MRAALYRMLADMPGMEGLGQVTDPAGQQGAAVGYTASYKRCGETGAFGSGSTDSGAMFASCTTQEILIIDPATGLPMAEEVRYAGNPGEKQWPAPDGLFSYEIFGRSYWTNQNPPKPANPPQVSMQPMSQPSAATHGHPGCVFTIGTPAHTQAVLCPTAGTGNAGTSR